MTATPAVDASSVYGLLVPADPVAPVVVLAVKLSGVAFSEVIGGGLLDETGRGAIGGRSYTVFLDADRVAKALTGNDRAAVLAARLGLIDRAWLADLRVDALVLGCDHRDQDIDVPPNVVVAACSAGLFLRP